jgi:hypothetical protein
VHTMIREVNVHCQAVELVVYKAYKGHGMKQETTQEQGTSL